MRHPRQQQVEEFLAAHPQFEGAKIKNVEIQDGRAGELRITAETSLDKRPFTGAITLEQLERPLS